MPTYRDHQELVDAVHELADLLVRQAQRLVRISRRRGAGDNLPDDSALHATWQHLGTAFQLLTEHARSLRTELDRLGDKPSNNVRS